MWAMLTRTAPSLTFTPTWATSMLPQRAPCPQIHEPRTAYYSHEHALAYALCAPPAGQHMPQLMQFSWPVQVLRPLH